VLRRIKLAVRRMYFFESAKFLRMHKSFITKKSRFTLESFLMKVAFPNESDCIPSLDKHFLHDLGKNTIYYT
jgi:hypothetical protein